MRWSATNTQWQTATSRSHYKPFDRISQRVFETPMNNMTDTNTTHAPEQFAAFVAVDWADENTPSAFRPRARSRRNRALCSKNPS